jgi:hypothetical protein
MKRRWPLTMLMAVALPAASAAQAVRPVRDSVKADTGRSVQRLPETLIKEASPEPLPSPFLRRSRIRGTGKFLTAKDIEVMNPTHTPQLLARVSGGDIREIGNGNSVIVGNRGTRMTMLGNTASQLCVIALAINDVHVPPGFDMRGIRPADIAAVEFYNGPSSIPLELGGTSVTADANCGLFVIWLKERRAPR